jgi:hypothetical protein
MAMNTLPAAATRGAFPLHVKLRKLRRSGIFSSLLASPAADLIVLDTLGKLRAHGHVLDGYSRGCWRRLD